VLVEVTAPVDQEFIKQAALETDTLVRDALQEVVDRDMRTRPTRPAHGAPVQHVEERRRLPVRVGDPERCLGNDIGVVDDQPRWDAAGRSGTAPCATGTTPMTHRQIPRTRPSG
jgi:hypothetical protein